ncbi:hypothetical protein ACK32Z_10145 [Aeromonas hydrophila]|uniref:hypothetical protein n=1 Tax=Aeromonas hydrophila TaxID=644 RepID=UPI002808DD44|nr:hypothetical protein [Aeromonas hydrophila]
MTPLISSKSTVFLIVLTVINGVYNWMVFTPSDIDNSLPDKITKYAAPAILPVKPSGNLFTVSRERVEVGSSEDAGGHESKKEPLEIRLVAITMRGLEHVAVFQGEKPIAVRVGEQLASVGKVIKISRRQVEVENDSKIQVFEIFPIPVQPK